MPLHAFSLILLSNTQLMPIAEPPQFSFTSILALVHLVLVKKEIEGRGSNIPSL